MPVDNRFEQALRSEDPVDRLRSLAQGLLAEGLEPSAVLAGFEAVRRDLREADREGDEDAVMDVMDFLVGWCSPEASLVPVESKVDGGNTSASRDLFTSKTLSTGFNSPLEKERI